MDNKKDISYKTNTLVERPNTGVHKDVTTEESNKSVLNSKDSRGGLQRNQTNNFYNILNKKIERLVTALYMVTSFLSDSEPVKWKLRECNVALLSGINNARDNSTCEVENIFVGQVHVIEEIISLLEISVASKLISEMNFNILLREYSALKIRIESKENSSSKSGKFTFSSGFFREEIAETQNIKDIEIIDNNKDLEESSKLQASIGVKDIDEGQLLLQKMSFGLNKRHDNISNSSNTKAPSFSSSLNQRVLQTHRIIKQPVKKEKTDRTGAILKLFKKGKELTIKDISCEVFACSEKTIQRELLSLVSNGLLTKKGERRWSRYSLK